MKFRPNNRVVEVSVLRAGPFVDGLVLLSATDRVARVVIPVNEAWADDVGPNVLDRIATAELDRFWARVRAGRRYRVRTKNGARRRGWGRR